MAARSQEGVGNLRIHSLWLETDAPSDTVELGADKLGADMNRRRQHPEGRLFPIFHEFTDRSETPWENSTISGTWLSGLVEIRTVKPETGTKLLGIIGPSMPLVDDLLSQFGEIFNRFEISYERSDFELSQLLGSKAAQAGIKALSVRLRSQDTTTLIRSEDPAALRKSLSSTSGELVGVTVRAADQMFSILPGGTIIFDEPSVEGILGAMASLEQSLDVPTGVSNL